MRMNISAVNQSCNILAAVVCDDYMERNCKSFIREKWREQKKFLYIMKCVMCGEYFFIPYRIVNGYASITGNRTTIACYDDGKLFCSTNHKKKTIFNS